MFHDKPQRFCRDCWNEYRRELRQREGGVAEVESDKKAGEFSWREWAAHLRERQGLRAKAGWTQDRVKLSVDAGGPIGVLCLGDLHFGAVGTDYGKLLELTDLILRTPDLYVALLGDVLEMAILGRSVAESDSQLLSAEEQEWFLEAWLEEIAPRVLWATWGNHDVERQEKKAGASGAKRILSRAVPYFNGIGEVSLQVGEQTYEIATSHKFRGRSIDNRAHAVQRHLLREDHRAEIGIMGDFHEPGANVYEQAGREKLAVVCGTLHKKSGYGNRYFSLHTSSAYPVIELWPDRHLFQHYYTLERFLLARRAAA